MSMVQSYHQFLLICPVVAVQADNQVSGVHQSRPWRYGLALHSKIHMALLNNFLNYKWCTQPEPRIGETKVSPLRSKYRTSTEGAREGTGKPRESNGEAITKRRRSSRGSIKEQ